MKHTLKATLFSLVLFTGVAQSSEFKIVTDSSFSMATINIAEKFEDTLLESEGFLKRFNPAGVEVKRKVVSGNSFEYLVVKKFLGVSKEVEMIGTMTFERVSNGCQSNEAAYLGAIDFTGSQPVITDNIESFTMLMCASGKASNSLSVRVRSSLFYKGEKLGFIVEKFVTSVIKDQVEAIVSAIKTEAISR